MASSQAVRVEDISESSRSEESIGVCLNNVKAQQVWQLLVRPTTCTLAALPPGQQLRNLLLDKVQQLDGVGHPQHQRLQTWDQLLHAEHLKVFRLPITRAPDRKGPIRNQSYNYITPKSSVLSHNSVQIFFLMQPEESC